MLNKNELKALLREHNIRPNKRLGQNFLVDKNMQQKVLQHCNLCKEDIVLEVGAGLGALTFHMAKGTKRVFAVEKDRNLADILRGFTGEWPNIQVITCDILTFDIKKIFEGKKIKVIGNLPYYITSPIISYLIENRRFIDSIFLTVQKEVAARLAASPGTKAYSPISIYTQFYTEPRVEFLITRRVFYPKPEVDSAFVRIGVSETPRVKVEDEELFFKVVKTAFSKRRKTILNALSSGNALGLDKSAMEALLKNLNIKPTNRPENLSPQDFANITDALQK